MLECSTTGLDTTGYDVSGMAGDFTYLSFNVSGVSCANGYEGFATVLPCAGDGSTTIQLDGCDPVMCETPPFGAAYVVVFEREAR